jgi:hypothetical protein
MTGPDITTPDIIVALDEATGSLALARFLPSEAQSGAECALQTLEGLPEDIRARFAGCISFARDTAAAIIADSESPPPWNNDDLLLLCNDLATALNAISAAIRPVTTQPIPPQSPRRQHGPRKPSIATLIKRAEETGKAVTSITLPDGTTINFDETKPSDASNPWLADIEKATKQ